MGVSSDLLVQQGSGGSPTIYQWGSEASGAKTFGYSGRSLLELIRLMSAISAWLHNAADVADITGNEGTDLAAALAKFIGDVVSTNPEFGDSLNQLVTGAGQGLSTFVGDLLGAGIAQIDAGIEALQGAFQTGQTVWYVQATWNGGPGLSQEVGLSDFETGFGSEPPTEVLMEVGTLMIAQCVQHAATLSWRNTSSPGLLPWQDNAYTTPCM